MSESDTFEGSDGPQLHKQASLRWETKLIPAQTSCLNKFYHGPVLAHGLLC